MNTPNVYIVDENESIQDVIDSCPNPAADNLYTVEAPPGHESDIYAPTSYITITRPGRRESTFVIAAQDSLHRQTADLVCDGTDDHVQITEAIDALPALGGQIVLLDGNFVWGGTVNMRELVWIKGQGEKITTLSVAPGFNETMFAFNSALVTTEYQYECYFSDFFATGFGGGANCKFLDSENQHATGTQWLQDVKLFNLAVLTFSGDKAMHIKPAWGFRGIGLAVEMNLGTGLHITGGQNPSSAQIRGCQVHSNTGHGIVLQDVEGAIVMSNELNGGTDKYGVNIVNGSFVNVDSNCFLAGGANAGGHVYMDGTTGICNVVGNQLNGGSITAYGVRIAENAVNNIIGNNQFFAHTVKALDDLGLATVKQGNTNYGGAEIESTFQGGIRVSGISEHADNTAALAAGLVAGAFYRTGDITKIVH